MARKHTETKPASSDPHRNRRKKRGGRSLVWLWVTLGALVIVGVAILVMQPGTGTTTGRSPTQAVSIAGITPAQAYAKYQQGVFFLDVRTQAEWDQFHLQNSTLIPLDQLPNRLSELPKDKEIVVVCLSGHRAQSGAITLQQAGFTQVSYLNGGLQAWTAAGYQVEGKMP
jgi:rhodanese-related sulfurtransferase